MARVQVELTIRFDPDDEVEVAQVAENLAKGMSAGELTGLWLAVDQAIRHPAHLTVVAETVRLREDLARLDPAEN